MCFEGVHCAAKCGSGMAECACDRERYLKHLMNGESKRRVREWGGSRREKETEKQRKFFMFWSPLSVFVAVNIHAE